MVLAGKGNPKEINEALADMSGSSGYRGEKLASWVGSRGKEHTHMKRDVEHFRKQKSKVLESKKK